MSGNFELSKGAETAAELTPFMAVSEQTFPGFTSISSCIHSLAHPTGASQPPGADRSLGSDLPTWIKKFLFDTHLFTFCFWDNSFIFHVTLVS